MKVMHVMGELRPSGMERMLISAAPHFIAAGVEGVIVGQGSSHSFRSELAGAGYSTRVVPSLRSREGRSRFVEVVLSEDPDVIHLHTEGFYLPLVLLIRGRVPGKPIVRTVHNVFQPKGFKRIQRRVQANVADRLISQLVACSGDVSANEWRFGRCSIVVMNWVDDRYTKVRNSPERDGHIALTVGNCSTVKNHELALRAAREANFRVAHVGEESGASASELALLRQFQEADSLVARGSGDPIEWLKVADVFMFPSLYEGMGVALAEAIAAGVRCLVSDVPGVQWAKGVKGVTHLPLEQSAWEHALMAHRRGPDTKSRGTAAPDLSAKRGVQEYLRIYRRAIDSGS